MYMIMTLRPLAITAALFSVTTCGANLPGLSAAPLKAVLPASGGGTEQVLLADAFNSGKDAASRCAAIKSLGSSRDEAVRRALAGAVLDPDMGVRACASLAAGESRNRLAGESLKANIASYLDPADRSERTSTARLAAINSVWSLGETGDPAFMSDLIKFYESSDNTFKVNTIISMGKLGAGSAPFIKSVAASPKETGTVRAAAFEMLEEMGQNPPIADPAPSQSAGIADGDIIYSGGMKGEIASWLSPDIPVGHAGIFAGTETKNGRIYVKIGDCVPNHFKPGGVRNINAWKDFTQHFKHPYYGNRTTNPAPTGAQRRKIVGLSAEMGTKGLTYDISHISQKGPLKFDCVGYTEYIYEAAGLNPTDNRYETGWGWPLTPWEQFSSMDPGNATAPPHTDEVKASEAAARPSAAAETLKSLSGAAGGILETPADVRPAPAGQRASL